MQNASTFTITVQGPKADRTDIFNVLADWLDDLDDQGVVGGEILNGDPRLDRAITAHHRAKAAPKGAWLRVMSKNRRRILQAPDPAVAGITVGTVIDVS